MPLILLLVGGGAASASARTADTFNYSSSASVCQHLQHTEHREVGGDSYNTELTQPEKDVIANLLHIALTPEQIAVVVLIIATQSALRQTQRQSSYDWTYQLLLLMKEHPPPTSLLKKGRPWHDLKDIGRPEHRHLASRQCEMLCGAKHSRLPQQSHWAVLIIHWGGTLPEYLQNLETDKAIGRALYCRLYPREAIACICGLPKVHEERAPFISSINSLTYNISKLLASILARLVSTTYQKLTGFSQQAMRNNNTWLRRNNCFFFFFFFF